MPGLRRVGVGGVDHPGDDVGQVDRPGGPVGEPGAGSHRDPVAGAPGGQQVDLVLRVVREQVERDHGGQAVGADAEQVPLELRQSGPQCCQVGPTDLGQRRAPVQSQRLQRRDQDDRPGPDARRAAGDVEELLAAEVEAEPALGDDVGAGGQGHPRGDHRVGAVGDVGERPAVHQDRPPVRGLGEVGHEGVAQQGGHGRRRPDVVGGDGEVRAGPPDHDPPEPGLEVGQVAGQAQGGHDLARGGDLEAGLPRDPVQRATQAQHDVAQEPVVHVDGARPGDPSGVQRCLLAELQAVVDQRREQVVRRGDGVQVAGEVQVDGLGRLDRGSTPAGAPALHPEHRAQGGLAQGQDRVPSSGPHAHGQGDGHGGLALPRGGGGDRRDEDQSTGRLPALEGREVHLRPVRPPADHMLRGDPQLGGDIGHGAQFGHAVHAGTGGHPVSLRRGCRCPAVRSTPARARLPPPGARRRWCVRGKPQEDVGVEQRER